MYRKLVKLVKKLICDLHLEPYLFDTSDKILWIKNDHLFEKKIPKKTFKENDVLSISLYQLYHIA